MTMTVDRALNAGPAPTGQRMVAGISGAAVSGRLAGEMVGGGNADWFTMTANGLMLPRSAAAVRGNYGVKGSAVASAPGVQGRGEGGAVTVPLSAVAGPGLRSAMAVEAGALVHAGVGEFPEATRRSPRVAHGRLKVGQVASIMNTSVLWLGGQVATREADVERCVGIGTGQGKCLRRGKPRPVPSRREAYRG
jgi:hypothetical protein